MSDHDFDQLRAWANRDADDLAREYSPNSAKITERLISALGDEHLKQDRVSPRTFVAVIHRLHELLVTGSQGLGEAILQAGENRDQGDKEEAKRVLRRFINSCPSKFYQDIATDYINRHLKK